MPLMGERRTAGSDHADALPSVPCPKAGMGTAHVLHIIKLGNKNNKEVADIELDHSVNIIMQ